MTMDITPVIARPIRILPEVMIKKIIKKTGSPRPTYITTGSEDLFVSLDYEK